MAANDGVSRVGASAGPRETYVILPHHLVDHDREMWHSRRDYAKRMPVKILQTNFVKTMLMAKSEKTNSNALPHGLHLRPLHGFIRFVTKRC